MPARAFIAIAAAAASLSAATFADAQSLKSLRVREAEEGALAREVAYTNSVCGSTMSSSIDWRTANWPEGESIVAACDGALGALEAQCRSGAKKNAALLTSFTCAGDSAGPSLSGGDFRYGATPGESGFSETQAFLAGAL
ncbi:MAG: hypothetical protein AB7P23_05365 [Amphiplicatus sp.]